MRSRHNNIGYFMLFDIKDSRIMRDDHKEMGRYSLNSRSVVSLGAMENVNLWFS